MTQKIEKLLSVNNQKLHGTVEALYNQWYRAQIINFIIASIFVITTFMISYILIKRSYKKYISLSTQKTKDIFVTIQVDTFIEYMATNKTGTTCIVAFLLAMAIIVLIDIGCSLPDFMMEPKIEFLHYIFNK